MPQFFPVALVTTSTAGFALSRRAWLCVKSNHTAEYHWRDLEIHSNGGWREAPVFPR
jgi:hypothetical protein